MQFRTHAWHDDVDLRRNDTAETAHRGPTRTGRRRTTSTIDDDFDDDDLDEELDDDDLGRSGRGRSRR